MKKANRMLRGIGALVGLAGTVSASCDTCKTFLPTYYGELLCCSPTRNPADITELSVPCAGENVNMNWIYENCWFDNQVDLKVNDGRIEFQRLGGTDNLHKPNVSNKGNYFLVVEDYNGKLEDYNGKPVYASRVNLTGEFSTTHWPARGGQFRLRVQDENCGVLLEQDVSHIALRY